MTLRLLVFSLFISTTACSQTGTNQESNDRSDVSMAGWKTLEDAIFSIQYPPEWELNQTGQMGTSFILLAPPDSGNDAFRENMNLLIQDLKGYNMNLDEYTALTERQVKTHITNGVLLESKRVHAGDNSFQKMVYTGDQGIFKLHFIQYFWVRNENAYILTFTSEQDRRDDYMEVAGKLLDTFVLKK